MNRRAFWTRRKFVQGMGCLSFAAVGVRNPWLTGANPGGPRFAYVGSTDGIQVFAVERHRWTLIQAVASEQPVALALHPIQKSLYAVNAIDSYQGLPVGTVESFGIDPDRGRLTLLNRQPLSLSGTMPRHLAVSPDGRHVVVAVHGGGAYNVLPIDNTGSLRRVSGIVKEVGCGPDKDYQAAAHPQMVLFDATGRHVLGADMGSDRLSVFALSDDKLAIHHRMTTRAGSGPRHMALHPSGELLYVANHLEPSVSCYGYDAAKGRLLGLMHQQAVEGFGFGEASIGAIMIHRSGLFLYAINQAGDGISVWRIDPETGALKAIQFWNDGLPGPHSMAMTIDGTGILLLNRKTNSVFYVHVDSLTGKMSESTWVATVSSPMSIVLKYV